MQQKNNVSSRCLIDIHIIFNCHQWQWFTSSVSINRSEVINRQQQSHALVIQITDNDNLTSYMATIRAGGEAVAKMDPAEFSPDGRYRYTAQVSERLNFLSFLLRDGRAPAARTAAARAAAAPPHTICHLYEVKLQGISSEQFRMILLLTLFRVPT